MLYNINWNLVVLRMEKYQEYLKEKYQPLALITYGSFQCGTNDEYSDFDCMIIVEEKTAKHDSMVIDESHWTALFLHEQKSPGRNSMRF